METRQRFLFLIRETISRKVINSDYLKLISAAKLSFAE